MSKEFKIKIKNNVKIKIESSKLEKMILKIKGKNDKNEIFVAHIKIKFNNKLNILSIKKINISKLEIENSLDEFSYTKYRNIYNININSLMTYSSNDENINDIYNQLIIFTKNIKLLIKNNKCNRLFLTLKNTNIKKIKLRGKINY